MSNNTNLTIQIGNLVNDPELITTASGNNICKFAIAVNDDYKDTEYCNFFDIVVFGGQGVNCNTYLKKGAKVSITGKLRQDRWENEGQKRSKINIIANKIEFLGGKQQENTGSAKSAPAGSDKPVEYNMNDGDSIPF